MLAIRAATPPAGGLDEGRGPLFTDCTELRLPRCGWCALEVGPVMDSAIELRLVQLPGTLSPVVVDHVWPETTESATDAGTGGGT